MDIGPRTDIWEHETEVSYVAQYRRVINGKRLGFTVGKHKVKGIVSILVADYDLPWRNGKDVLHHVVQGEK